MKLLKNKNIFYFSNIIQIFKYNEIKWIIIITNNYQKLIKNDY